MKPLIGCRKQQCSDEGGAGSLPVGRITVGSKWVYSCVKSTFIRVQRFYGISYQWTTEVGRGGINLTSAPSENTKSFTVHREVWHKVMREELVVTVLERAGIGRRVKGQGCNEGVQV